MKTCKILGYKPYDEKDTEKKLTGKKMLRIVLTIKADDESGFIGRMPAVVFFEYNEELCSNLSKAINEDKEIKYETIENILTGKTKVSKLIFE